MDNQNRRGSRGAHLGLLSTSLIRNRAPSTYGRREREKTEKKEESAASRGAHARDVGSPPSTWRMHNLTKTPGVRDMPTPEAVNLMRGVRTLQCPPVAVGIPIARLWRNIQKNSNILKVWRANWEDSLLKRCRRRWTRSAFCLIAVAGWMNQQQQHAIEYLREENRILRAQLGSRRLRLTDDQRRSLAAKARLLGRRMLAEMATIVTPETLLRWHRKLIANKYDGSTSAQARSSGDGEGDRSVGRPYGDGKPGIGVICESRARCRISAMNWHAARLPTS